MSRALVIVDIQNDHHPGGRCELVVPQQAAVTSADDV
jgi:nicotinamidase-related amidase